MGNRHNSAFEVVQEAFQPRHGFGIQVVRRFVEQQHVWFFQQQAAQRHATTLTTGEVSDFRVPVRQTQRIRRTLQLNVQVVTVVSLNDLFQTALFSGQLVKIGIRIGVQRIHFIQAFQGVNHFRNRFFNGLTHGVFRVQLRFLRQVTNLDVWLRTRFTFDVFINARHNAQQGGLTRAVQTQDTNFCPREETQRDVFQNMTFRRNNFADTMHGINELSHVGLRLYVYRDDEFSKAKCSLFPYLIPAGRSPSQ